MENLTNSFPLLNISADDHPSPPPAHGSAFFSVISRTTRQLNNDIVKKIEQDLDDTDLELGLVYVAEETDTPMTKVGFSIYKDARGLRETTNKCKVNFGKKYQTPQFYFAHRAEQIIHNCLRQSAYERLNCECGKNNCEWYRLAFIKVVMVTNIVHTWMAREPYNKADGKLKSKWEEALNTWVKSQDTPTPLTWPEFFLTGPSLCAVSKVLPKSPPCLQTHESSTTINIFNIASPCPWPQSEPQNPPGKLPSHGAIPTKKSSSKRRANAKPSKATRRTTPDASPSTTPVRRSRSTREVHTEEEEEREEERNKKNKRKKERTRGRREEEEGEEEDEQDEQEEEEKMKNKGKKGGTRGRGEEEPADSDGYDDVDSMKDSMEDLRIKGYIRRG